MSTPTRRLPLDCQPPGPVACRSCELNEVCRLMALEGGSRGQSTGALRAVATGEPLFRAGAPAHSIYAIRQGMLKSVRVSVEGEETVLGIHTPGELLGLEAFGLRTYAYDAVALQPVVCCELSLPVLSEQSTRVRELGTALFRLLGRAAEPRFLLARGTVRRRVTAYLLDLAQRLERHGLEVSRFSMGLSRQELADLLDTRIETVSRMIQRLNREHAIRVHGSSVSLLSLAQEPAS
jgi:CRP/FNR family transcriptional regulator, anaerobic regulatory protein